MNVTKQVHRASDEDAATSDYDLWTNERQRVELPLLLGSGTTLTLRSYATVELQNLFLKIIDDYLKECSSPTFAGLKSFALHKTGLTIDGHNVRNSLDGIMSNDVYNQVTSYSTCGSRDALWNAVNFTSATTETFEGVSLTPCDEG